MKKLISILFVCLFAVKVIAGYGIDVNKNVVPWSGNRDNWPNIVIWSVPSIVKTVPVKYLQWPDTIANCQANQLAPIEMSQEDKDAVDQAIADAAATAASNAAAALAQAQVDWENSKTNYADIVFWENRFMANLNDINALLVAAEIDGAPFDVASTTPEELGEAAILSSNETAINLAIAMDLDLKYVEKVVRKRIGNPPDGSTILENIISH